LNCRGEEKKKKKKKGKDVDKTRQKVTVLRRIGYRFKE